MCTYKIDDSCCEGTVCGLPGGIRATNSILSCGIFASFMPVASAATCEDAGKSATRLGTGQPATAYFTYGGNAQKEFEERLKWE